MSTIDDHHQNNRHVTLRDVPSPVKLVRGHPDGHAHHGVHGDETWSSEDLVVEPETVVVPLAVVGPIHGEQDARGGVVGAITGQRNLGVREARAGVELTSLVTIVEVLGSVATRHTWIENNN